MPARSPTRWVLVAGVGLVVLSVGAWPVPAQVQGVEMTLVSITSPVQVGELVTLVVQTRARAYCGIDNRDQLGPSKLHGLLPQRADERGQVRWTWLVDGTRTPPGQLVMRITCAIDGQQGALEASLAS